MIVGTLEVELRMDGCHSLKEKRAIIRPILDRTRRKFGVSSAEVGDCDLWNSSVLGFAIVSNDPKRIESCFSHLLDDIETIGNAEIVGSVIDVL